MFLVGKVFDDSFNLRRIIDVYSSFIWNEYYIGYGDFQLRFPMDASALDYIKEGWYLSIDQSDKFMIIEKIGIETDVQNGNYASVEGRSLESILLRRFIRNDTILTGSLQTGIMRLIQSNMLTAAADNRRIERVTFTPSTDPRITSLTTDMEYSAGDNLYDAVVGLCDYEKVGFKITPNFEDTSFVATLYIGDDRSYKQDTLPWVVFSSKYENLKSSNMALDTRELKNAAIIENHYTLQRTVTDDSGNESTVSEERTLTVEIHPEITGLERREIFLSYNISPESVDKSKFGKKEDRVNIRDYQTYQCVYFDSKAYQKACSEVDDKYSARIDPPKTTTTWVRATFAGNHANGETIIDGGGLHYYFDAEKSKSRDAVSAHASDTEKPDWLLTHEERGFKQVTLTETPDMWRNRNARTFAAWEKAYPNRREFEVWAWDFPNATKRQEYQAALAAAQVEIDAEYDAAILDEEEKVKDQMRVLGLIELAQYSTITNFEGEVDTNVQFIYGKDYFMGDIVQIVNEYDFQAVTRVVSMLFSEEEGEGFKALPSFESDDPSEVEL